MREREIIKKAISNTEWYSTIDIDDQITTKGFYDWRPYFKTFEKLTNYKNKTLLDVGCGDGFFSHKFYDLKSKVTGIEIPSQFERDNYIFGELNKKLHSTGGKKRKSHNFNFLLLNKIKKRKIPLKYCNIYNLNKLKKKYDIVFCNDLLLHLTDPIRAIHNLITVSKKYIIIGNPIIEDKWYNCIYAKPVVEYLGHKNNNAYYIFNKLSMINLLKSFNLEILKIKIIKPAQNIFYSARHRMIILATIK
jgi:2-polyprenyl-3-methyl-5-hydroxy-6-metoxy-1,4-benzoquinol methylase